MGGAPPPRALSPLRYVVKVGHWEAGAELLNARQMGVEHPRIERISNKGGVCFFIAQVTKDEQSMSIPPPLVHHPPLRAR